MTIALWLHCMYGDQNFNCFIMTMKLIRNILIALIVILLAAYGAASYYTNHLANKYAKQAIAIIKANTPSITTLAYKSISTSPLRWLTNHGFTANDITIKLKNLSVPLRINHITYRGKNVSKDHIGSFTFKLDGLQFDNLNKLVDAMLGHIKNPRMAAYYRKQISAVLPKDFNPDLSVTAKYNSTLHQADLKEQLTNQQHMILNDHILLGKVHLNRLFHATNKKQRQDTLGMVTVLEAHGQINIQARDINLKQLVQHNLKASALLQQNHLEQFSISIKTNGAYSAKTGDNVSNIAASIPHLFSLKVYDHRRYTAPLTFKPIIALLTDHNENTKITTHLFPYDMIKMKATLINQGLIAAAFDVAQQFTHLPKQELLIPVTARLNGMVAQFDKQPRMQDIFKALLTFVKQPKSLTISVEPKPTISRAEVDSFIAQHMQKMKAYREQASSNPYADNGNKPLTPQQIAAQKQLKAQQYQQQMLAQYQQLDQFLGRLGFSIVANEK